MKPYEKYLIRFALLVLISIIPQAIILYIFNNSLTPSNKYKYIPQSSIKVTEKPGSLINLQDNIDNMDLSTDGKYLLYKTSNSNYEILDIKQKTTSKLEPSINSKILNAIWVPEENKLFIAEEEAKSSSSSYVKFYSYDVKKSIKKETGDYGDKKNYIEIYDVNNKISGNTTIQETKSPSNKKYAPTKKITLYEPEGKLKVDISISCKTGITYAKIEDLDKRTTMYRIDNDENIRKSGAITSTKIGNFKVSSNEDLVLYEDLSTKKIKSTCQTIQSTYNTKNTVLKILGSDLHNKLYLAEIENDEVVKICYGHLNIEYSDWDKILLKEKLSCSKITITPDGKIYCDNNDEITNLVTKASKKYQGKLISIRNNTIYSNFDNKLTLTKIE